MKARLSHEVKICERIEIQSSFVCWPHTSAYQTHHYEVNRCHYSCQATSVNGIDHESVNHCIRPAWASATYPAVEAKEITIYFLIPDLAMLSLLRRENVIITSHIKVAEL